MTDSAPPMPPPPDPALKQLDFLIGTWQLSGATEEGPMGPPAKLAGTETFEWLEGGYFLVHRWNSTMEGPAGTMPDVGYEFFDYDPQTGRFRSHYFSSFGPYDDKMSHYDGQFEDGKFVLNGPARFVRALNDDGSLSYDCEVPTGDGGYMPFLHAKLTKLT